MSYENIKNLKKLVERTNRSNTYYNSIFKDNYMDIIKKVSYHFGTDSKEITEKLDKLKPEDFYKLFTNDKAISSVLDYYMVLKDDIDPSLNQESANDLFELLSNNIDEIISCINFMLNNFEDVKCDFDLYREKIKKEESLFEYEIKRHLMGWNDIEKC